MTEEKTLDQLQKELATIEKQIEKEYKDCPYDYNDQYEQHSKWYRGTIVPLQAAKDELENKIYSKKLKDVKIGDGVTTWTWTDRYAYTVIARTAKTITIQRDKAIRTDSNGMSDCQDYRYERDPEGGIEVFRWSDKKHRWVHSCYKLALGRSEYYDYSF